jgi:hypothetical protein
MRRQRAIAQCAIARGGGRLGSVENVGGSWLRSFQYIRGSPLDRYRIAMSMPANQPTQLIYAKNRRVQSAAITNDYNARNTDATRSARH